MYNSGEIYRMGDTLLKNYYSVYDIDNYKMALGRVIDFDAPVVPEDDGENSAVDPNQPGGHQNLEDFEKNALIFSGIVIVFLIVACFVCKRRRDEERRNSGS